MSTPALTYSVRDRSILLPHYKRFLVEPLLPFIPKAISPNAITHGGHLINLAALVLLLVAAKAMAGGWPFFAVPLLVHIWLWCDHADGGHARRTNQCSAMGEYLDHGLDLLNATYVICMTVVTLGTPPFWSVAAAVIVPAAAAVTYWEQAETGVFQLGLLNQIESVCSLTAALFVRGLFGVTAISGVMVAGHSLSALILVFVTVVALFGIFRSAMRVAKAKGRVTPFLPPMVFGATLAVAARLGAVQTLAAITCGASVYVYFGVRQLTFRVRGERPPFDTRVLVAAAVLAAIAVHYVVIGPGGGSVGATGTTFVAIVFGGLALIHGLEGHRAVERLERDTRAARDR